MKKGKTTFGLGCLILCAACSTDPGQPPDYLLEKAPPLDLPTVVTTQDIVERALEAESAYNKLRSKHNILIDWILPEPS